MILFFVPFCSFFSQISAHGALGFPPARQWICSRGPSPNMGVPWNGIGGPAICDQNLYAPKGENINTVIENWSSVSHGDANWRMSQPGYASDPLLGHKNVIGTASSTKICGAGSTDFSALTETVWQNPELFEEHQFINPGQLEVVYKASAPHNTQNDGYFDVYITKPSWNKNNPVTWADIEAKPFCSYTPNSFDRSNTETWKCDIPDRPGQHVLFTVWQRHDSPEAFYSCSDVIISGEVKTTIAPKTTPAPRTSAPKTTKAPETTEKVVTTPKVNTTPGDVTKFCQGKADGYYGDPADQSKFIVCQSGHTHELSCPAGLVWDAFLGACNWPSRSVEIVE